MTYKEFESWCNYRACDGCWSMKEAIICIGIIEDTAGLVDGKARLGGYRGGLRRRRAAPARHQGGAAGIRRADSILYPAQPGAGNSAHHQF